MSEQEKAPHTLATHWRGCKYCRKLWLL